MYPLLSIYSHQTIDPTSSMNSSYERESGEEGVSINRSILSHETSLFDEIDPVDGVFIQQYVIGDSLNLDSSVFLS